MAEKAIGFNGLRLKEVFHRDGSPLTEKEADRLLRNTDEEPVFLVIDKKDWKDEKNCALCDREFYHYESVRGGYAEKRYLAGHLVCASCFEKSCT